MDNRARNMRQVFELLQPSVLSGTIAVASGLIVLAVLTFPRLIWVSSISQYLETMRDQPDDIWASYAQLSQALNTSDTAANASVLIVWAIAGLIGYAFVASIIRAVRNIIEFEKDVAYFQRSRAGIVREALLHIFVRLLAVFLLLGLYFVSTSLTIPAVAAGVQAGLGDGGIALPIYYLLSLFAIMLSIHAVTIFARLTLLRTRIFYDSYHVANSGK